MGNLQSLLQRVTNAHKAAQNVVFHCVEECAVFRFMVLSKLFQVDKLNCDFHGTVVRTVDIEEAVDYFGDAFETRSGNAHVRVGRRQCKVKWLLLHLRQQVWRFDRRRSSSTCLQIFGKVCGKLVFRKKLRFLAVDKVGQSPEIFK